MWLWLAFCLLRHPLRHLIFAKCCSASVEAGQTLWSTPTLLEAGPDLVKLGEISPNSVQRHWPRSTLSFGQSRIAARSVLQGSEGCVPSLAHIGPASAEVAPNLADSGPQLVDFGPSSVEVAESCLNPDPVWLISLQVRRIHANVGRIWAEFGPTLVKLAQGSSTPCYAELSLGQLRPKPSNKVGRSRGNLGRARATFGRDHPPLGDSAPNFG